MKLTTKVALICSLITMSTLVNGQEFRSVDGAGNNKENPEWGSAGGDVIHAFLPAYEDGISTPSRSQSMNARVISNLLFDQPHSKKDPLQLSDFAWSFGQFVDHDIVLTENFSEAYWMTESASIEIPDNDPVMTPGKIIPLIRTKSKAGTGTDVQNPRSYENGITAFLDASAVYGSSKERSDWLRSFNGGKLKVSKGNRLPWNTINGEFSGRVDQDAPEMLDDVGLSTKLFVAGDIRANENPMLLSIHLLFVREHNRLCDQFLADNPTLNPTNTAVDEMLYQRARKVVGAILQHIVYNEWLPSIGIDLPNYEGYDSSVNPSITNTFSAASFRWGHTMINEEIKRIQTDGSTSAQGHILLNEAFFNPIESLRIPLEDYFKGMGVQVQQSMDCQMVGAVRNFLFEDNAVLGGLDLAAINIQRGRERGVQDYNSIRALLGLEKRTNFNEICVDNQVTDILEMIYNGDINQVDPWVGMLAEDSQPGSIFGEVLQTSIRNQFEALRDGDRFFYQNDDGMLEDDMHLVRSTTLSSLIMRNTEIICFQNNAFEATPHNEIPCFPEVTPSDLRVNLAPNPVLDQTYITLFSSEQANGKISIVNELGQTFREIDLKVKTGMNQIVLDLTFIPNPGIYYVMIERGEDIVALKVIKI